MLIYKFTMEVRVLYNISVGYRVDGVWDCRCACGRTFWKIVPSLSKYYDTVKREMGEYTQTGGYEEDDDDNDDDNDDDCYDDRVGSIILTARKTRGG